MPVYWSLLFIDHELEHRICSTIGLLVVSICLYITVCMLEKTRSAFSFPKHATEAGCHATSSQGQASHEEGSQSYSTWRTAGQASQNPVRRREASHQSLWAWRPRGRWSRKTHATKGTWKTSQPEGRQAERKTATFSSEVGASPPRSRFILRQRYKCC